jgi:ATP-dependent protease HslVU (ClpYQ) peptidase subunit
MTTIVVVKKNGYVAIGTDTMTKLGATFERADYIENHRQTVVLVLGRSWSAIIPRIIVTT